MTNNAPMQAAFLININASATSILSQSYIYNWYLTLFLGILVWFFAYLDVIQIKIFYIDYVFEKVGRTIFDIDFSYPIDCHTNMIINMGWPIETGGLETSFFSDFYFWWTEKNRVKVKNSAKLQN